jgi:glycosyltransferase involved in cell wall biosynthesis
VAAFFSVGVTTFNRRDFLKEALSSILMQTFQDYEVIVGNDYPQERLCGDLLGLSDQRIRFINYAQNQGELRNMNHLLEESRGRYFTWLADDDLFAPDFLETVHAALVEFQYPPCVFTAYAKGKTFQSKGEVRRGAARLYTGSEFVKHYLNQQLKVIGCYGVFEREYIRRAGGVEQLGTGFAPYSDNLLAIRAGLLDRVAYINAPLVFYRTHEGSVSYTSGNVVAYTSAQEDLFRKSLPVLQFAGNSDAFQSNLFFLMKWCLRDFSSVVRKAGGISMREAGSYLRFVGRHLGLLRGSTHYWQAIGLVCKMVLRIVHDGGTAKLRRSTRIGRLLDSEQPRVL